MNSKWQYVPVEPTFKQLGDSAFNLCNEFGHEFVTANEAFAKAVYRELLSNAPNPEDPRAGALAASWCCMQTDTVERMEAMVAEYCRQHPACGLGEVVADLRLMLSTQHYVKGVL